MQIPEKPKKRITKSKIREWIDWAEAKIPELESNANAVGSCWESEKLGYARGYVYALKEILGERD
jgi:hypothetical protein